MRSRGRAPADHDKDVQPDGRRRRPRARARARSSASSNRAWSGSGSTASTCIWLMSSIPRCRWTRRLAPSSGRWTPARSLPTGSATSTPPSSRRRSSAGKPQAIQNERSLLARADEAAVLPLCEREQVAYLGIQPAGRRLADRQIPPRRAVPGGVADDPAPRAVRARSSPAPRSMARALGRARAERDDSMAGLALAWLLADERVTQIVVGPGRPEHLEPVREAIERAAERRRARQLEEVFSGADPRPRRCVAALRPAECADAMARCSPRMRAARR